MSQNVNGDDDIAIIGMSSLFPEARNLQQFWNNIFLAKDTISDIPKTHWDIEDYYDPDPNVADKTYCKRGGFIPETSFNPVEFGIPPNTLDVIGVLQLLSLSVAKSALFNAGYLENESYEKIKERTGVVLGITSAISLIQPLSNRLQSPKLQQVLQSRGLNQEQIDDIIHTFKKAYAPWEENSFPGMLGNVVAGRVANRFDMGGANCTIDAACASSLAALRMSIDELQTGRADMMLTGGCDAENTILMYLCFSKTPAFSPRGIISPFDLESDGTLIGEGIGMLALKRLADAEANNDSIYAVIKGLGSSSDGKFKSIYAPRQAGQVRCLARAYDNAGFSIDQVGLIEAHGTGTKVGDATEIEALTQVTDDSGNKHIAVGSVKSQIGHTKAAAGAASLIKVALSLHHKLLPPSINIKQPAEVFQRPTVPLYPNTELRPWVLSGGKEKRRAGVSSFGFGGTNYHAVLEEYTGKCQHKERLHSGLQQIVLAASTPELLLEKLNALLTISQLYDLPFEKGEADLIKIGFSVASVEELSDKSAIAIDFLEKNRDKKQWKHPKGIYFSKGTEVGKVAGLFSGQGSQYLNMGSGASLLYPKYVELLQTLEETFYASTQQSLADKIFPIPVFDTQQIQQQSEQLTQTEYAQPAIAWYSAASYLMLKDMGLELDCTAGHSFGELSALWAAGAISLDDLFRLSISRGQAMKFDPKDTGKGAMLAVSCSVKEVEALIEKSALKIYLCNFNTPQQIVVGGEKKSIDQFSVLLEKEDIRFIFLNVSAAFHTPLVKHSKSVFEKTVKETDFSKPNIPLYRNKDGIAQTDPKKLKTRLKQHLLEPVRFQDIIENMINDGVRTFIEFGPKRILSKMVEQISATMNVVVNTICVDNGVVDKTARQLSDAVIEMAVIGMDVRSLNHFEPSYKDASVKPGFTVDLNGMNYVSESKDKAWQEGLLNPDKVWSDIRSDRLIDEPVRVVNNDIFETTMAQSRHQGSRKILSENQHTKDSLELVGQLQSESTCSHNKFLDSATHTANRTLSLLNTIKEKGDLSDNMVSSLNQGFNLIAESQNTITDTHNRYIEQINTITQQLNNDEGNHPIALDKEGRYATKDDSMTIYDESPVNDYFPAPLIHEKSTVDQIHDEDFNDVLSDKLSVESISSLEPVPANTQDSLDLALDVLLIKVVAEKTGYPEDVLEPSMDMETDLGIDSIKRVEILGELQSHMPNKLHMQPEKLVDLRTLEDLMSVLKGYKPETVHFSSEKNKESDDSWIQENTIEIPEKNHVRDTLLDVVSQKTGYPITVLELSMDMESDLGIDSIKRVEILGEMQKILTTSMHFKPEIFINARTLHDIIEIVSQSDPNADTTLVASTNKGQATESLLSVDKITQSILDIVSQKTGYPKDVIDIEMDLESDLGIDSIKRVEILGELRSVHSDLVEPSTGLSSELRTLKQIVNFLSESDLVDNGKNIKQGSCLKEEIFLEPVRQYAVELKELIPIELTLDCYSHSAHCLVISEENTFHTDLLSELKSKGFSVSTALWSALLNDLTEDSVFGYLDTISSIDIVIINLPATSQQEINDLKLLLLIAKYYKNKLDIKTNVRKAFISLCHLDGKLGLSQNYVPNYVTSGCFGLIKTLAMETDYLFCRAIDIDSALSSKEAVKCLVPELFDHNIHTTDIGLSESTRYSFQLSPMIEEQPFHLPSNTCFIVTGGARGITAKCILGLAKKHGGRYLLLGRSKYDKALVSWAENIKDENLKKEAVEYLKAINKEILPKAINKIVNEVLSHREIENTLESFRDLGVDAKYVAIDIHVVEQVNGWMREEAWLEGEVPIALIHGAGALADKLIEEKTLDDFDKVFSAKLFGIENILGCIDTKRLIFSCQFSSVAGLFGNAGQVDYAMANEILNRLAIQMNKKILNKEHRSISLIWGAWNAGMVTPNIKALFESRGVVLIDIEEGVSQFVDACSNKKNTPLVMVGPKMALSRKKIKMQSMIGEKYSISLNDAFINDNAIFNGHTIGGQSVLPATFATGWVARIIESLFVGIYVSGCEKIHVKNGIVIDKDFSRSYILNVQVMKADQDNTLYLDANIEEKSSRRIHYTYKNIKGVEKISVAHHEPIILDSGENNGKTLYERKVLFHGDDFQLIKAYQREGKEITLLCQWKTHSNNYSEKKALIEPYCSHAFCPMHTDALLQAALVWVKEYENLPSLPVAIEQLECYQAIKIGQELYIRVGLLEKTHSQSTLYVSALNDKGEVSLTMKASVIKSAALLEKFTA